MNMECKQTKYPLVSVIIPNYNHEKYLEERIDSVLNQTYQNIEVIILDDKSSDNSIKIIDKYRGNDKVSHIIINDKNSGSTFKQWERGLTLSKGDIIWIAESDDSCDSQMLEYLVNAYLKKKETSIAYCYSLLIDENSVFFENQKTIYRKNRYVRGKDYIRHYLSLSTTIPNASSAIFSRECAIKISKDYMQYKGAGDRLFWTYLSEMGNVAVVRRSLNYFRRHRNTVTQKRDRDGLNAIEDKLILDYITNKHYISKFRRYLIKTIKSEQLVNIPYDSDLIRQRVYKIWNIKGIWTLRIRAKISRYFWILIKQMMCHDI